MNTTDTEQPRVSIIVPAYQAASHLPSCVEALSHQTAAKDSFEVLIVDDGSSDRTAETPLPQGYRLLHHERNRGAAAARNTGARAARGQVLLFVDVDVVPSEALVEAVLDLFFDPSTGEIRCRAATGCYDPEPANDGWFPRYKALWTWFCWRRTGEARSDSDHLQGALCAISKAIFWQLDGFDEGYLGGSVEDYEFSTRLRSDGSQIMFDARIRGKHRFPGFLTVARNYWARTRMWLRLRFGTQSPRARTPLRSGQANARAGAGALLALAAVVTQTLSFLPIAIDHGSLLQGLALASAVGYLATVSSFLIFALRRHGIPFASYALVVHFALSVVVGIAALSAPLGAGSHRSAATTGTTV
ncbi:MAG TPA: hypothetical protein DIU15_12490 [Deltaproteobacteria bacterium]|nr:hypothetical protein [Deltaproteobacteria bacterium]HCP46856.1 hypothetical protein [Deltaproteobacteria bacterium]